MPDPTPRVEPLFPRAHKLALGFAFGLTLGVGIFLLTLFHIALNPPDAANIELLNQYFLGYEVTWPGAFAGLAWGFGVGFVAGWLLGFVHNFTLGVWMLVIRAKADLKQTSNFLDHI